MPSALQKRIDDRDTSRQDHQLTIEEGGCQCSGCQAGLQPQTVEHFVVWAQDLVLDSGEAWTVETFQQDYIRDVFALDENGDPLYPECWLVVPEGNAKSTLVAGLVMYDLQHVQMARVPVAAASKDQAAIIFERCEGFVIRSRGKLLDVLGGSDFVCQEGFRRVKCPRTNSRIQIFSAEDRTGDGIIPTKTVLEELHRHRDLSLYRTWMGKSDKRGAQALVISTAGEPGGEFEDQRERLRRSADETDTNESGTFTRAATAGSHVLHDWSLPEDGNPDDLDLVAAANPLAAVTRDTLERKRNRPSYQLAHWRRFTCGLPTRAENAAITEAEWAKARTDERIPEGEPVGVGLDVAWKWDTTAIVPLWIPEETHRLLGEAIILEPPRNGDSLDPDEIERALISVNARNPIHTVVMDTSRAEQLASWAEAEFGCMVVDRGQSNTFAVEDYDRWMEALRNGWLFHPGDRGLTSHVMNAVARVLPGGDTRFDRPVLSRKDQIQQKRRCVDALTAGAMVHTSMSLDLHAGVALVAVGG